MSETNEHGQEVGDVVDWTPREPARAVHLQGQYVALEPLRVHHAAALLEAVGGPEHRALWTYRPDDVPLDLAAMESFLDRQVALTSMPTMVIVPTGDVACGLISWLRIEPVHGQVEVAGVMYAPRLQRTRAATEAVHLLMRHAFEELGYRRFEWKCDSLNKPSRRAAARLGFAYEGRFEQHMVTKGRNRDTDWFCVTDRRWPAVRAAQGRWLDPSNFDEAGAQRTRLSVAAGTLPT